MLLVGLRSRDQQRQQGQPCKSTHSRSATKGAKTFTIYPEVDLNANVGVWKSDKNVLQISDATGNTTLERMLFKKKSQN